MPLSSADAESAESLGTLIESLPDAILLKDGAGHWKVANAAGLRLFKLLGRPWQGKTDFRLAELYPELAGAHLASHRDGEIAWASRSRFDSVARIPDGTGGVLIFEVATIPLFYPDGSRRGLVVTARDVTERKRAEASEQRHRASLHRLNEIAALSHLPLSERLHRALSVGAAHLGLEFGIVSRIEGDAYHVLSQVSPADTLEDGQTFQLGASCCRIASAQNEVLAIAGMGESPQLAHPCYRTVRLGTYIGAPVAVGGRVYGTANFSSPHPYPRPFDQSDKEFVHLFARWVGSAIEREQTERRLAEREELFSAIFNQTPSGIELIDPDTLRFVEANPAACRMLGYSHDEYLALGLADIQAEMDEETLAAAVQRIAASGGATFEGRHRTRTGEVLEVEINARMLDLRGKRMLVGVWNDITGRKRAEENLRITASVFENSQEAILITDADNAIIDVNPAFTRITGYRRDEVVNRDPRLLNSGRQDEAFYGAMWQALKQKGAWRGEVWNRRKSGDIYAELLSISAISGADGKVQRYVGVFSDISHFKQNEAELSRIAHFDALTAIPNRVLLADRMRQGIARTVREQNMAAVCYLDLDGFKEINDTLGHEAGDQVLIEVARRIGHAIRGGDTVARLGGDEFVVVLLGLERGEECVATLERLLATIAQPISVKDKSHTLSASIGVSIFPLDDEDPDTLLSHADQAMYAAKRTGKNRFYIYDPALDVRVRSQREFLRSIRHGLERGQFELHYLPTIDLRTKRLLGAEALIRWRHPERGLLSPAEFLHAIENSKLDVAVGDWVIATALGQLDAWRRAALDFTVSVNVSAHHLESPRFLDKLRESIQLYPGLPSGRFQIDIRENAALGDTPHLREVIEGCRRLGVGFALDDYGTGCSSLSCLSSLPVDALKIDQSFVRDMLKNDGDMTIVQSIIALARAFGLLAVAEGIEAGEHFQTLLEMGCDAGQGYDIARPMPANELAAWLAR